jgi:hypothetical protein
LPLRIKPVKVKQSIYLRVPNDIADLIEIDPETDITMRFDEQDERYLLVYAVRKSHSHVKASVPGSLPQRSRKSKGNIRGDVVKDRRAGGF